MHREDVAPWSKVELELHSHCNRDCDFCPRHLDRSGIRKDESGRPVRHRMPTGEVCRIIDELHDLGYRGTMTLHRLSEPFLDPRFPEVAAHIKSKGMTLFDHTNGDVLRENEALCTKLDGIVDTLRIGLYDYATHREKKRAMRFWREKFQHTEVIFSLPLETTNIRQNSGIYDRMRKDPRILDQPCRSRVRALHIRYDGEVSLCCQDDHCTFDLGNVFTQSIDEIWRSDRRRDIIQTLSKTGGRRGFALCSKCLLREIPAEQKGVRQRISSFKDRIEDRVLDVLWRLGLVGLELRNRYRYSR